MDIEKRNHLVATLGSKLTLTGKKPGPTVSLEAFFDGNDDLGSIGCNLLAHPGVNTFYRQFLTIRARPDVQDVLVEVTDLVDDASWPFADTVFVLTSMNASELKKLTSVLHPDEVGQFPESSIPEDLPALKPGMRVLGVWWD